MAQAGVPPVDAGAAAPLNLEVRSIDYVPRSERHGKTWHLGAVWFVGNAELVSFATGPIGISLGLNFAWTAVAPGFSAVTSPPAVTSATPTSVDLKTV